MRTPDHFSISLTIAEQGVSKFISISHKVIGIFLTKLGELTDARRQENESVTF